MPPPDTPVHQAPTQNPVKPGDATPTNTRDGWQRWLGSEGARGFRTARAPWPANRFCLKPVSTVKPPAASGGHLCAVFATTDRDLAALRRAQEGGDPPGAKFTDLSPIPEGQPQYYFMPVPSLALSRARFKAFSAPTDIGSRSYTRTSRTAAEATRRHTRRPRDGAPSQPTHHTTGHNCPGSATEGPKDRRPAGRHRLPGKLATAERPLLRVQSVELSNQPTSSRLRSRRSCH
jgi:hypothetical protein